MTIGSGHFAVLSAVIFCIGLAGVLTRRNAFAQLMALSVMFTAPVIAAAGFAQTEVAVTAFGDNTGAGLGLVLIAGVTAQIGVGLGVLMLLVRRRHTLDLDNVDHLMG